MDRQAEPMRIQVRVHDAATGLALGEIAVQAEDSNARKPKVLAQARTRFDGIATLTIDPSLWRHEIVVRATDQTGPAVSVGRAAVDGSEQVVVEVVSAKRIDREQYSMLSDYLVATRRLLTDDLVSDIAAPAPDSIVRLLPAGTRAKLLADLGLALGRDKRSPLGDGSVVDPHALRNGRVHLLPISDVARRLGIKGNSWLDPDLTIKPGRGWDLFPGMLPDDQSYRDYLRSVFVLFAHQQKLGFYANPGTFPAVVERQLQHRFFQDFRTPDRAQVPLNRLLIPIMTAILTAPTDSGFGFGVSAADLPAQGTNTDRQHLDALLGAAAVPVAELVNRYRLPLAEPDSVTSSPVALNIHTLSRVLSDTAQGPVEPPENIIEPQLPGEQDKPILWEQVIGAAPFFLRFDEWLARQQPFFAENLFSLRSQIIGTKGGPWLTEKRKAFLEFHLTLFITHSMTSYTGYFSSMDEVHRSAAFLLAYGAADSKLVEVIAAIDANQFATAARLVDEADALLTQASFKSLPGEDWEPSFTQGNFPRPIDFSHRRKMKVTSISQLTGTGTNSRDGFEQYFDLARPNEIWPDIYEFRTARDQATRLRVYQQKFLIPMLRAAARSGIGDLPGTVQVLGGVTGMYIGIATLGTPAGMIRHPYAVGSVERVVAGGLNPDEPLGDRPYTARLTFNNKRNLDGPYSLTPQFRDGYDVIAPDPPILHALEERYARIVQADALLEWAEALYRTDDAASLERARELYKAVIYLHGEDPGTIAYPPFDPNFKPWFGLVENPRVRNQLDRARLALQQLEAGVNFYGYDESVVPTLRYDTLTSAAQRWATGAKSAQADYLSYLGRIEQLDLDLLAAKAQERKARATVAIAAEQVEIAQAGVVVANKLVSDIQKQIVAKQKEIKDANSIFSQFKDYFKGMKDSVTSLIDVGKSASQGWTSLSTSGVGEALGLGKTAGTGAAAGAQSPGLGSAMGGLGVVGGYAAFAVLSTTTLQGMADAATKRDNELKTLEGEALPAAQAAVRVQERNVSIAHLQAEIATTDLAYARDLITYQNERFLNRDFWNALAGVARRSLHRYLDLAAQAAWFAERALAYQLDQPLRVIKLGYFDAKMRDIGGIDRLSLDLAELEAVRLAAARITVPVIRTYSLAQDLPLAFGQLKATGSCTFNLTDEDLLSAHPGTYAHRIRAVDVVVDTPGTTASVRGILTNGGFSRLRREPGGDPVPLVRFADAYPISEFQVRKDFELYGLPGEQLLPFEGSGFTTSWTLEIPQAANTIAWNRIIDVRITFNLQAAYTVQAALPGALPQPSSRAVFVSALAMDATGLKTLSQAGTPAKITLGLDQLALPPSSSITNLAVLLPGVSGGSFNAELRFGSGQPTQFEIADGLAMSNMGTLGDGNPANALALNKAAKGSPARVLHIAIAKGQDSARLARARDVLVWVEYEAE